jgi:hypothetical protein
VDLVYNFIKRYNAYDGFVIYFYSFAF